MENGFKPISEASSAKTSGRGQSYASGNHYYYNYGSGRNTTSSVTTSTVSTPVKNSAKKEVVTEIKEVIKEVPKTNKWLIAGAATAGGILGWLGAKLFSDDKKQVS